MLMLRNGTASQLVPPIATPSMERSSRRQPELRPLRQQQREPPLTALSPSSAASASSAWTVRPVRDAGTRITACSRSRTYISSEPPKPALPLCASATSCLITHSKEGDDIQFKDWCLWIDSHRKPLPPGNDRTGREPGHGDPGDGRHSAFIEGKLPTTKNIRSGDLGEIYAAHVAVVTARRSNVCVASWWRCLEQVRRTRRSSAPDRPIGFRRSRANDDLETRLDLHG